jgi:hypothetical protein
MTTSAVAVTFNFSGNGGLANFYSFSEDGIDLLVTPGAFVLGPTAAEDTVSTQGQVGQYNGGLGISQAGPDSHTVDGGGTNELLRLAFSETVRFVSAEFRYIESGSRFEFWHDSANDGALDGDYQFTVAIPGSLTYTLLDTYIGDLFGIGALKHHDSFKLYSITVSPVPLPAALPLFAGALGLFSAAGWRQRRKAAAAA